MKANASINVGAKLSQQATRSIGCRSAAFRSYFQRIAEDPL